MTASKLLCIPVLLATEAPPEAPPGWLPEGYEQKGV